MKPEIFPDQRTETLALLDFVKDGARAFMEPPLEYHGWDHITYSFDYAMKRCDAYEAVGNINVDRLMVGCAVLLHDAGKAHHIPDEFETDEEYHAFIAGSFLSTYGFNEQFIAGVQNCIRATNENAIPSTPEEKLTCQADIANVFGPYPGFVINAFRLYEESRHLKNKPFSFSEFRRSSSIILNKYLSKDLVIDPMIDCDYLGKPIYMIDGLHNVERLARASSKQLTATLRSLGESAIRFIPLVPSPRIRNSLLSNQAGGRLDS